jgi:lipopolysaccharide export system protein LptC
LADGRTGRSRGSARSRTVGILKVVLPLGALALLAAVFLWQRQEDWGGGLTFSDADLEAMRSGLRISGPQFSGASLAGDIYDFSADWVVPEDLEMTSLEVAGLEGEVLYRDGRRLTLRSDHAQIDVTDRTATLDTGIEITSSEGYRATATRVEIDLAAGVIEAAGPIDASGPDGTLEAGAMRMAPRGPDDTANAEDTLIDFTGGVRMTYIPPKDQ